MEGACCGKQSDYCSVSVTVSVSVSISVSRPIVSYNQSERVHSHGLSMVMFVLHTENTGDGRLHQMEDPFWIRRHLYSVVIQYLSVLSGMSIDLNVGNPGHRNCKFYESRTTGHAGERMCVYIKKRRPTKDRATTFTRSHGDSTIRWIVWTSTETCLFGENVFRWADSVPRASKNV